MTRNSFIIHLLSRGLDLVKSLPPHTQFFEEAAAVSKFLKFPCKFDKETGCCQNKQSERCCCMTCASTIGYFGSPWPNDMEELSFYAEHFDAKDGFWRKGKGCILPRWARSITCAYHVCYDGTSEFEKMNKPDVVSLHRAAAEYSAIDYRYGGPSNWEQYGSDVKKSISKFHDAVFVFQLRHKVNWDVFDKCWRKIKKVKVERNYVSAEFTNGGSIGYGRALPKGVTL